MRELERVTTPLQPGDRELAARYLRFDYEALPTLDPRSPWARLAATYARMFAAGNANDHVALSQALAELSQDLPAMNVPATGRLPR